MTKCTFVELKLNGTLVVRERSSKQLKRKLKMLNVEHLFSHPKSDVLDITTNMPLSVGNIFEATL